MSWRTLRHSVVGFAVACLGLGVAATATAGTVSGTITIAGTATPIQGANVQLFDQFGNQVFNGFSSPSDATGFYSITATGGPFYVKTSLNHGSLNFIDKVWNGTNSGTNSGANCEPCNVTSAPAQSISVGASTVTVNFALNAGGGISGTVTNTSSVVLQSVNVSANVASTNSNGNGNSFIQLASAQTDATGKYSILGLPAGSYFIKTQNTLSAGYIDQVFPGLNCLQCSLSSGTAVTVTGTATTTGTNFTLQQGGLIAGTVFSTAAPTTGVGNVSVSFYDKTGTQVGSASTNSFGSNVGSYSSSGLPASGSPYYARTTFNSAGLINQLYSGTNCLNSCTVTTGTQLTVTVGATTPANFSLPPGGSITGTVVRASNSTVISNVSVSLSNSSGGFLTSTGTNGSGVFTFSGLPADSYYVKTQGAGNQGFIDQVYATPANQPCAFCNVVGLGSLVAVSGTATTGSINFSLVAGGTITGTVTDSSSIPLANVQVQAIDSTSTTNQQVGSTNTNSSGAFSLAGLPAGSFYLRTSNGSGFINVVYDGASGTICNFCNIASVPTAVVITVSAGSTFPLPHALVLAPGKTITGTVRSGSSTGTPVSGINVNAYNASGSNVGGTQTNSSGVYTLSGLQAGTYFLRTNNSQGFIDQFFDGIVCSNCPNASGTPIDLTSASSSTANFALTAGGRVSGTVTDAGGTPIASANVAFFLDNGTQSGQFVTSGFTNAAGTYTTFGGMAAGTYYAQASASGYVNQLSGGSNCNTSNCSPVSGTKIIVAAGATTPNVNFALLLGGSVSGTITDNTSTATPKAGIGNINVSIFDSLTGNFIKSGTSTASGAYSVTGLPGGTYTARTSNSIGFIDELFNDLKCPTCSASAGQSFAVVVGQTTPSIDFGLDRGGRISGTVTGTAGALLANVNVSVYDSTNKVVASTSTNQNGVYTTGGISPGTQYFVRTTFNSLGYINQLYLGQVCVNCSAPSGTAVTVTGTAVTSGIDFALAQGGSISGKVIDANGGAGVPGVSVSIFDSGNLFLGATQTGTSGTYTVGGLPLGGPYFAKTFNSVGYVDQLYDGQACSSCSVTGGKKIGVTGTTTGINFTLAKGGGISGLVTDAGNANAPLGGVNVQVFGANGQFITGVNTNAFGVFATTGGLVPGTYLVKTSNTLGYVDQIYPGVTCLGCNITTTGTVVTVTATAVTPNINFSLVSGGFITGTVRSKATGLPIENVSVSVFTGAGYFVTSGYTNGTGTYKTGGVPAGSYYVRTNNNKSLIDGLYNGKDCTNCNPALGAPVQVATGQATTGIDFSLGSGGRVLGNVVSDAGIPLPGVSVNFLRSDGTFVASGFTDALGNFVTFGGIPTGTYYSRTSNSSGLIDRIYNNKTCASCQIGTGNPIAVTAGADTTGINYVLSAGGRISGTVIDAITAAAVPNVNVSVFASDGTFVGGSNSSTAGKYILGTGLATGNYYVEVFGPGYIASVYKVQTSGPNNVDCSACSPLTGSTVAVTAGQTTPAINFSLNPGGLIAGTVVDSATSVPLNGIGINVFNQSNSFVTGARTDTAGRFTTFAGLPAGTYFVRTNNNQSYVDMLFNTPANTVCLGGNGDRGNGGGGGGPACKANAGLGVVVVNGQTTSGINFGLALGGSISGTVTDAATGLPLSGVRVGAFDTNGKNVTDGQTDNVGQFTTNGGLPTGQYYVRTGNQLGYVDLLYPTTTCLVCNVTRGTQISVTGGSTTSGVNFALSLGGQVAGKITASATGAGLGNISLVLYNGEGTFLGSGLADGDGSFLTPGLPPGNYLLRTVNSLGLIDQSFQNHPCAPCPMTPTAATPIAVTAKTVTSGVNFALDQGGLVSGLIIDSVTGAPVSGVTVSIFQNGVFIGKSQASDSNGRWVISLPVGTYTVVADAAAGYTATTTSLRAGSSKVARSAAGTTITVGAGAETSGVTFPLAACTAPAISPLSLPIMTAGQPYSQTLTATGGTGPYSFSVSSGSLAPGVTLNAATGVISGTPTVSGTSSFSVAATDSLSCSGTQDFTPFVCSVGVGASAASFTSGAAGSSVAVTTTSTDCGWTASSNASWIALGAGSGTGSGSLSYTVAANTSTAFRTGTITVGGQAVTVTQGAPVTSPPFGVFDTPTGSATIAGSVAVTGWALDDLSVNRVEIWRDAVAGETTPVYTGPGPGNGKIFIANPSFVSGARPDVAAAYASYPFATRAGWGYLMLTQGLWNQGNGTYKLYAFAYDQEGNSTVLGSKTITVSNSTATIPFGSIDTPTIGQTVSGSFWNFGWGLTPGSTCALSSGTVQMGIDSQPLVNVTFGGARTDIAAAFPGFTDGSNAGGAFYLDTTTLTDGTHSIGWLLTDNCGRAAGVGSRFFTVANGTGGSVVAASEGITFARAVASVKADPVTVSINGGDAVAVTPNAAGLRVVQVGQSARMTVQLPTGDGSVYTAYQLVGGVQSPLPLGSSFDVTAGVFYWEPAAAFLGSYDLAFVAASGEAVPVRVIVGAPVRAAIDTPQAGAVNGSFVVAGWAVDLASGAGTGVDAVQVWATPVAGGTPIFVGNAAYGGGRPDVAALYGTQFAKAGYGVTVNSLASGTYDLSVTVHRTSTNTFEAAQVVRVTVR